MEIENQKRDLILS